MRIGKFNVDSNAMEYFKEQQESFGRSVSIAYKENSSGVNIYLGGSSDRTHVSSSDQTDFRAAIVRIKSDYTRHSHQMLKLSDEWTINSGLHYYINHMAIDTAEDKIFGTTRDADDSAPNRIGRNVMLWMISLDSAGDLQSDLVSYKLAGSGMHGEDFVVTGIRPTLEVAGGHTNMHFIVFNTGALRMEYHVRSLTDGSG